MSRSLTTTFALSLVLLSTGACVGEDDGFDPPAPGASTGSGASSGGQGSGGGGSDSATVGSGGGLGSGGGQGGATSEGGGAPEPEPMGLPDVGSLVVLGDSIGDGGGQPPYYYDLLHDDLEAFYGGAIVYENAADSGSTTGALSGQIAGLPQTLPGPVVVVITSGGNNMKNNAVQVVLGLDDAIRQQMVDEIDAALQQLQVPGRFGPGVDVHVFEANIYDASDGQGNFASGGCAISMDAPNGSTEAFASWNQAIADVVSAHQQVLVDMHGHFTGHGFNSTDNWYAGDCTHPNATGHAELEQLVFGSITGG